jgi:hypothetical protein
LQQQKYEEEEEIELGEIRHSYDFLTVQTFKN